MCEPLPAIEPPPTEIASNPTLLQHLLAYGAAAMLQAAREQNGLTQAQLAGLLRVRQSTLSQWERRWTLPSLAHLLAVLDLLGDEA